MSGLSRDALADWLRDHYGPEQGEDYDWHFDADALAQRFKLPLDADGPGITRCKCGHPVGDHRNGEDACRGLDTKGGPCKCKKARVA